jgi:plasmid stabilization system protein ParE
MNIIFTSTALGDIHSIYQFNASMSPSFAKRIQKKIFEEVRILQLFPELAPVEPLFSEMKTVRSYVVANGRYKIFYYIEKNVSLFPGYGIAEKIRKI